MVGSGRSSVAAEPVSLIAEPQRRARAVDRVDAGHAVAAQVVSFVAVTGPGAEPDRGTATGDLGRHNRARRTSGRAFALIRHCSEPSAPGRC